MRGQAWKARQPPAPRLPRPEKGRGVGSSCERVCRGPTLCDVITIAAMLIVQARSYCATLAASAAAPCPASHPARPPLPGTTRLTPFTAPAARCTHKDGSTDPTRRPDPVANKIQPTRPGCKSNSLAALPCPACSVARRSMQRVLLHIVGRRLNRAHPTVMGRL
jgi:hypothetical protein